MGKEIKSEFYIQRKIDKGFTRVLGTISDDRTDYQENKGYIKDGLVWVFSRVRPIKADKPYFWFDHGKPLYGKVRDSVREVFSVDKIRSFDINAKIRELDPDKPLLDEEALSDMNASAATFIPDIKETDDFLKKIIKKTIIEKKINVARLKSKMGKSYSLSNLKTALMNNTKMSVPNFITWADLLCITFDIFVQDSGFDTQSPLKNVIHYSSETDTYTLE